MRVRFRFTKCGRVRFTSHRDVARVWERALRRAALPVASTEGFSPRPKVHFGLALPTGHESLGEYLDVDFRDAPEGGGAEGSPERRGAEDPAFLVEGLPARLSPLLPDGIEVQAAVCVDRSSLSLQEAVTSCTWRIDVPDVAPETLRTAVDALLAAEALPVTRERKGKQVSDDLRPAIIELSVDAPEQRGAEGSPERRGAEISPDRVLLPAGSTVLRVELATQPRGVRPSELLAVLASFLEREAAEPVPMLDEGRVCRTHQWIVLDGARQEPLLPDATRAPHARARAS